MENDVFQAEARARGLRMHPSHALSCATRPQTWVTAEDGGAHLHLISSPRRFQPLILPQPLHQFLLFHRIERGEQPWLPPAALVPPALAVARDGGRRGGP